MTLVAEERDPVAQRILDATIATIDEQGEVGVRVQEVVRDAGVQIPVLYRHFGNREGLVQAAQLERLHRDLDVEMAAIRATLDGATTASEFRELMDEVLARIMSPERRLPRSRRANVLGSTYGRPELTAAVAAAQQEAIDRIALVMTRPAEQGWLRDGLDPQTFATWLASVAIGRVVAEIGPDRVDFDAYDAMWVDAVRYTLFG
ncbi:MAG: TetR/AcrR family transcriptional regulator [Actinomycetota bacterium]|nr:TetR/AcrR family transcriptional regulator [Actinomycetota bacterium]